MHNAELYKAHGTRGICLVNSGYYDPSPIAGVMVRSPALSTGPSKTQRRAVVSQSLGQGGPTAHTGLGGDGSLRAYGLLPLEESRIGKN